MNRTLPLARSCIAIAIAGAVAWPALAFAQSTPPVGSPSDIRYTPVTGSPSLLYPKAPDVDTRPTLTKTDDAAARPGGIDFGANAAVGRIVVEVARDAVPADGQSPVKIVVRVFDKSGAPLKSAAFLTIEHSGGRVLLPGARTDELGPRRQDADRTVPGVQLKVEGGTAEFTLLAPFEAQDVRLRISAGSEEASGAISFVPELRPMVAAGLVEGIVNFRGRTTVDPVRRGDVFEQEIESWSRQFNGGKSNVAARTAFFLKGTIRGDVLLTAAYDSDKDTRTRLLRDIRPNELYPVYGDSSLRSFDARSTSRAYVRLDRDKDYVLYGDFVTGDGFTQPIGQGATASLKQRSLGNYNRTATGVRAHKETGDLTASAFAFYDSLRQIVEEFASQGSGPYGLRNNAVLEGSDKVEVIVRDRTNSSRIVAVRPLVRLVDYSFEPFSGRIVLATFLPSVDENLNPVSLRVTYEVDQGGDKFFVYGGDAQYKLTPQIEIGGSAVEDRNGLARYRLGSANATWKIAEKTAIVVEVARTQSEINTNPTNQTSSPGLAGKSGEVAGTAWRVELAHEGDRSEARAFLGRSAPEFNNPAAPLNAGRGEGQASASYKLTETVKVYGEAAMSEDRNPGGGGDRKIGGAGVRWQATDRLSIDVGLRAARETIGTQGNGVSSVPFGSQLGLTGSIATGSGGGALGYGNQALDPSTGLPVITPSTGLAPAVSNLAPGTRLSSDTVRIGLGYKLTDSVRLGGEIEHDVDGDARRRYALGADWQYSERTKLYARYVRQEGWAYLQGVTTTGGSANAFVFGVDSTYIKDTQLYSEYRLRDAISGRDLQMASGVRNFWDVKEGLRLTTALEHIAVMSGQTASSNAASFGLDYSANPLWRGSARVELRRSGDIDSTPENERFTTVLGQVLVARKLDRDWTLLARDYLLTTRYAARGDIVQNRAQLGVAYRDTDTNRVNALGKIEWKDERDATNATTGELKSRAFIASAHADWHPSRPWWLTGRVAGKWQRDQFELGVQSRFNAQLVAGRIVYDVTENWDIGVLAATQFGQSGAKQYAAGAEVGYLLAQNLWLSGGVNVSGFKGDSDLTGYEYVQRGFYLRLRFKFDETLFKGRDKAVNPSLDR